MSQLESKEIYASAATPAASVHLKVKERCKVAIELCLQKVKESNVYIRQSSIHDTANKITKKVVN